MKSIIIKDDFISHFVTYKIQIDLGEVLTVKQVIRLRIKDQLINQFKTNSIAQSWIVPAHDKEVILNPQKATKMVDLEAQIETALEQAIQAFQKNQYFIFFNDQQVEDIHQQILFTTDAEIKFVKLTPLIGG